MYYHLLLFYKLTYLETTGPCPMQGSYCTKQQIKESVPAQYIHTYNRTYQFKALYLDALTHCTGTAEPRTPGGDPRGDAPGLMTATYCL